MWVGDLVVTVILAVGGLAILFLIWPDGEPKPPPKTVVQEMRASRARWLALERESMEHWEDLFDPERKERERVEKAARYYPMALGGEIWYREQMAQLPEFSDGGHVRANPPRPGSAYCQRVMSADYRCRQGLSSGDYAPLNPPLPGSPHVDTNPFLGTPDELEALRPLDQSIPASYFIRHPQFPPNQNRPAGPARALRRHGGRPPA